MSDKLNSIIAQRLGVSMKQVCNTIELLDDGATIPFISRYRKEMTGSLDEVVIQKISELITDLRELEKRKETIIATIQEQGKLTDELKNTIINTFSHSELEDLYLPYKPKKRTRATIAREKGLEGLAHQIYDQKNFDPHLLAKSYLKDDVNTIEEAIHGAHDIIAEWINEDVKLRASLRALFLEKSSITSHVVKGKESDGIKFADYYDFKESIVRCPSHRFLALLRGESEEILRISVEPNEIDALNIICRKVVVSNNACSNEVSIAAKDAYKRLLAPSLENECKAFFKEKADDTAIEIFAQNLRQLLLAPPLGERRVMAIDPGFRTGCKLVCLDNQGNLVYNETIFPHAPQNEVSQSIKKVQTLIEAYKIEAIAIGNGTAGRETEHFIKKIQFHKQIDVFVVSENGASIYSASKIAREEFPQYDVTVRGAVSIGRRLVDPLAELVKIDPKSIGVGQYQHDVNQNKLGKSLDVVVESCVNLIGVNVNTASKHLLTYVSGLGSQLAQNVVDYRKENGEFISRNDLKKVPRLGNKAYEQCAGFLRIKNSSNPLDNSAVHPESYHIVERMAKDAKCSISDLLNNDKIRTQINLKQYVDDKIGLPTLQDILNELAKPGHDPRKNIQIFEFAEGVRKIEDLEVGMIIPGIITNITNFGAFVDIGVKQDGLVHISQLADRFVSNPLEIVKLHQHVKVKVIEVDHARRRINLSIKEAQKNTVN